MSTLKRYDPVQRLPMGGKTFGEMQECEDGDFVAFADLDHNIAAAYFLAKGSYQTAKDNGIRLEDSNPMLSDEMKHLAANFLRISELLVEAGFNP